METENKSTLAYDDDAVETLEKLDYIRHRPDMWGCNPFTKQGVFLVVKEIMDNSLDEARSDPSHNHIIKVCFIKKLKGFQVVIRDDGRGIPLSKIEPIFTHPGTSGKWKSAYEASGGTHGAGAKATTAMSKSFCAVSSRNGEGLASLVVQDTKITHADMMLKKDKIATGTTVFFEPDGDELLAVDEFFDDDGAYTDIRALMDFISVFVPNVSFEISEGLECVDVEKTKGSAQEAWDYLNNIPKTNIVSTETSITPQEYMLKRNGVSTKVIWSSGYLKGGPIEVKIDRKIKKKFKTSELNVLNYEVELIMTHDFALRQPSVLGAVNMININDKTSVHLESITRTLKKTILDIVPEKYREFFLQVYNIPVHIISNVTWNHAEFSGQNKSRFTDVDFGKGITKALESRFAELGTEYWEDFYSLIAEDVIVKYKRKHQMDLDIQKSDKNLAFDLNNVDSFFNCRSNNKEVTELIICEGASAGGYAKTLRNSDTQAVFTLRGKPINALQMSFREAVKNDIFKDLLQVLGTTPNDEELNDMRFGKIVILTDADEDGHHITALLIGILWAINPRLLHSGKVIIASPPLYVVKTRNVAMFVRDNMSLLDMKAEAYTAIVDIALKVDDRPPYYLEGPQFRSFCYMMEHIYGIIETTSNKLNIDPGILEQLTHCISYLETKDVDSIKKLLGLDDCIYEKSSNSMLFVIGEDEMHIPMNGLLEEINTHIIPEFKAINYDRINFIVSTLRTDQYTNEMLSIVEIANIFKRINKQFGISRMKGLGQMDKKHLTETCLDPATRTYMVVNSPGDVNRIFSMLGVDTQSRKSLVNKNVN